MRSRRASALFTGYAPGKSRPMTDEQRRADRQTGARGDAAPAGHIGHYRERAPETTKERGAAECGGRQQRDADGTALFTVRSVMWRYGSGAEC